MPSRIIRESILSSARVAKLKPAEEVFYRRLQSIVDDYGRYEADLQLLRSKCYPLQVDDVGAKDIAEWLAACQAADLIRVYEVAGKQYLEILRFGQQLRSKSKCPDPPAIDNNREQPPAVVHLGVSVSGVVSEVEAVVEKKGSRKRSPAYDASAYPIPDWLDADTWKRWCKDRSDRKKPITEEGARQQVNKLDVYRMAGVKPESVLNHAIEGGHQGLFYPMPGQGRSGSTSSKHGAAAAAIFDHSAHKGTVDA
ncbi:hypothetical protein D9M73_65120 [compost metagenome]